MPLDALHLYAITTELNTKLQGARIDRVTMPTPDEVLFAVHTKHDGNVKLLLSANPSRPRVWLTPLDYVNPLVAPSFCMHLRKYLTSSRIEAISSDPYERIVTIEIESRTELGDKKRMRLLVEIMGRYSNIILTDENGKITDCIKHTPLEQTSARIVLPNVTYEQVARDPEKFDYTDRARLDALLDTYTGGDLAAFLMSGLMGLATATIKLALGSLTIQTPPTPQDKQNVFEALQSLYQRVFDAKYVATLTKKGDRYTDFTVAPAEGERVATLLDAQSIFYAKLDAETMRQNAIAKPKTALTAALKKLKKRITLLESKLAECEGAEDYKLCGELLTANIYRVQARSKSVELENYYDGTTKTVALDPTKTPIQNANAYYKKYAKLRRAATVTQELLLQAQNEYDYYDSILSSLDLCTTPEDLAEITEELIAAGLVKRQGKPSKKNALRSTPVSLTYKGFRIMAGKNNLQNDNLTFKTASANDLWLHVLHAHGSHVIVFSEQRPIPDDVISYAAGVAAYYSSVRNATKVPVDYTLKKHVLRNSSKGLGNVTYSHQQTAIVDPINPFA